MLLALGFVEREGLEAEELAVFYVLEEPSLDDDVEAWSAWFEAVKAHRATLTDRMEQLGVRCLPPAAKGADWSGHSVEPARPEECITLHGQRSGGL